MIGFIDVALISMKNRMKRFTEEFVKNQSGVSNFVATIILILIVVLLCVIFWGYIQKWFNQIWERITAGSDSIS